MSCTRVSQGEVAEGECWFMLGKLPGEYSQGPGPGRSQTLMEGQYWT